LAINQPCIIEWTVKMSAGERRMLRWMSENTEKDRTRNRHIHKKLRDVFS